MHPPTSSVPIRRISGLVALRLERLKHFARVAVVAFFVLGFVAFTTATRPDCFGVMIGPILRRVSEVSSTDFTETAHDSI